MTMSHLVNKIVNYFLLHCSWEVGGGGGGKFRFQVMGMI